MLMSSFSVLTSMIQPGVRVTVHIKAVPKEALSKGPITLFSLLQHERKVTVLNFTVLRNTEYEGSVRSKVCVLASELLVYSRFMS